MNISLFHNELVSVGLFISGCSSDGTVHFIEPDTDNLAPLVLAAHEKPLSSDECIALQEAVTEEQWLAYTEARKAPIKQARAERYKNECDPLRLKLDEDYEIGSEAWLSGLASWKLNKSQIRLDLPYPE